MIEFISDTAATVDGKGLLSFERSHPSGAIIVSAEVSGKGFDCPPGTWYERIAFHGDGSGTLHTKNEAAEEFVESIRERGLTLAD